MQSLQPPLWRLKLGHHLPWAEFWTVALSPQFLQCTPCFLFSLLPILLLSQQVAWLWLPVEKTSNFPRNTAGKQHETEGEAFNFYGLCFQEFMHHLYLNSVSNEGGYFLNYLTRPIEYLRMQTNQSDLIRYSCTTFCPHLPPCKYHCWDRVLQVFSKHYCHDDGEGNLLYLNPWIDQEEASQLEEPWQDVDVLLICKRTVTVAQSKTDKSHQSHINWKHTKTD